MAHWIEKRLQERAKTKSGLAKALGIPRPRVSEIVRGKRRIQQNELRAVAKYLEWIESQVLDQIHRRSELKRAHLTEIIVVGRVEAEIWRSQTRPCLKALRRTKRSSKSTKPIFFFILFAFKPFV